MINVKMMTILAICAAPAASIAQSQEQAFSEAEVTQDIALTCTFTQECIDVEACAETRFDATLTGRGGGPTLDDLAVQVSLQSVNGNETLVGLRAGQIYKLFDITGSGAEMMTIAPDGTAHYSVHFPDVPMAITYHGLCGEAK